MSTTSTPPERRQSQNAIAFAERRSAQRRRAKRVRATIPLSFDYQGQPVTATCTDISVGGVRIRTAVPIPVDTRLVLQISFNRNQCFMGFTGTVMTVEHHLANGSPAAYILRISFKNLTRIETTVLEACVMELERAHEHIRLGNAGNLSEQNISIVVTDRALNPGQFIRKRVVITGIGVISPIGIGKASFVEGLQQGRSGVKRVTRFDVADLPTQIAAEIDNFDPSYYLSTRKIKQMDRCTQFAVSAALMAVEDADLNLEGINRERIGGLIGTAVGGLRWAFEQNAARQAGGYKNMNPYSMIATYPNAVSGQVSLELGLKGRTDTISSGCASAGTAFGVAAEMIQRGELDLVVVGATEDPLEPTVFSAMCAAGALSTRNDNTPKPFDAERDGPVLGEGTGVLIFEELEHALRRGAHIYAEFKGWGSTTDAFSLTRTDPKGTQAARAVNLAMHDAGIAPEDVDFINAYGIATPSCDWAEAAVIRQVFDGRAAKIPVSAIQSMTGYPWATLGAYQMISNCLAISEGVIAPTINYLMPDPNCDLDVVPNRSRRGTIRTAMSNLFGCGKNVVLVTQKFAG
jgi:3-oxoacyl-[acyl-carrier-protein] synthase II